MVKFEIHFANVKDEKTFDQAAFVSFYQKIPLFSLNTTTLYPVCIVKL